MSEATARLQDVPGPSAFGGGWRRALELLYLLAVTDFKKHYFGTVFGYLWSIARPLLLFGVLLAVFTQVFRIGSEVPNYPVLLLFNIVLFSFFQEATSAAVTSIVVQEGIVRKTQFPRLVIPLSVVLTSLFNLGLNLLVVFVFIVAYGVAPAWTWLLLPVLVVPLIVITTAVVDDRLVALPALSRHGDHLVGAGDGAVLRIAGAVSDREGPRRAARPVPAEPARAAAGARAQVDRRSVGARPGGRGRRLRCTCCRRLAIFAATCVLAVWLFQREAPRIAEEL